MVITPCHYCSAPVYETTPPEPFAHNVVCQGVECQEQKRAAAERMQAAFDRVK